jgi:zinc protease
MIRFTTLLLALVLVAGCASTEPVQVVTTEGEATVPVAAREEASGRSVLGDEPLPLDPAVRKGRLDNGLTFYIRQNTEPRNRAELRLVVDAGSVLEDDDQLGLAHFVEHMLFNGTERFAEMEIVNFMERIGMRFGPDVNAYTGFDETVYMLQIPTDDLEIRQTAFAILSDWAVRATFDHDEIDAERGVVIEEWRARMQNAQGRIMEQILPVLLHDSRYEHRMPIGDPEIIRTADYETIERFYRQWYRPDLMSIVAVGDFDVDEIEALIRAEFEPLEARRDAPPRPSFEVPGHEATLMNVVTDPEYPVTVAEVVFKRPARETHTVDDYRETLISSLFNGMLNKRLAEIAREGDSPYSGAQVYRGGFVRTGEFYGMQAQMPQDSLLPALERLVTEAVRVERHGFTETELERQRQETLRSYQRAFNERDNTASAAFASRYVAHFLQSSPAPDIEFEYALVQRLLPEITVAEVNRVASDLLDEENRVVIAVMPERPDIDPPSEASIAAVLRTVEGREIAAYEDDVSDLPLIAEEPSPAHVVDETSFEEIETSMIVLDNGVRVVMRPTDFRQDEVLFNAFSPGGHSLVDDEEYVQAAHAPTIIARSGVGPFDTNQLQRRLSGQIANVTPYIGEFEEGLQGNASPEDLETLLQLIHLYFTQPRADSVALVAYQNQQRPFLMNRANTPAAVFQDSLMAALYGDDPRRQPPSVEMINRLDLASVRSIFEDRFADASDFTFVFVGNFEPSEVRRLAQTYLGTLPSTARSETWRNVRSPLPQHVVETTVYRGIAEQSQTVLLFHGDMHDTREERHRLRTLEEVLSIRLREDLREARSAVYGVNVNASSTDRPVPQYQFAISFTSDPARVEELIGAVFEQIESIQTDGPTADEMERVIEQQRRDRETRLRTNQFWLGNIVYYASRDLDPTEILTYDELIESVTADDVRAIAQRLLDDSRYVRGVLYPEASGSN